MMIKSDVSFLYKSNRSSETSFDCFYASINDDVDPMGRPVIPTNYVTPYCRRPFINDSIDDLQGYIESNHTFKSLRSQGIKIDHLLQWSISIDIIEQYAIYLSKNDAQFDKFIFYNCSLSWFGSHCQYTFGSNMIIDSFGNFLNSSFTHRRQYEGKMVIHTCYLYLSGCIRGPEPMCLDWREICDGKIDCIEGNFGIDEKYCDELEINECKENEYRCHNGAQCIPLEFFRDGWKSNDCLDGSDEVERLRVYAELYNLVTLNCIEFMLFACEETTCRQPRAFSCGDGNCLGGNAVRNIVGNKIARCKGTDRDVYYNRAIYMSAKQYPNDCYKLLFCKLNFYNFLENDTYNEQDCLSENWLSSINCTTDYLSFPLKPLFYGYFQPVYSTERLISSFDNIVHPDYICNDPRLCLHLRTATSQVDNINLDCRPFQQFDPDETLEYNLRDIAEICHLMGDINNYTSISSLFYCEQSHRYISKHRLVDGIRDCNHGEDEIYNDSCALNDTQRFPCTSEERCLSPIGIGLDPPYCKGEEDRNIKINAASVFPRLCNMFPGTEFEKGNDSIESNCDWWPCHTPYTRCDNIYQCANGIDELNCPNVNCKINEYKCSVIDSFDDYHCIPQEYIYEIPLDCNNNGLKTACRHVFYSNSSIININNEYISWKEKICITKNDVCGYESINDQQLFCNLIKFSNFSRCIQFFSDLYSNETLCELGGFFDLHYVRVFSIWNLGYFPSTSLSVQQFIDTKPNKTLLINTSIELIEYCNRGIVIFEGKSSEKKCLCPPNYFGHRCQWQNQRVSLTLQILPFASYEKRISIYHIFIYLIDDQYQIIHNYEEINYIPVIDCHTKYNRYLLYPNQPKNPNNTYSIHIDIYDKLTLIYYGSWYLFIPFPFLPVNRISTQIKIPLEQSQPLTNCSIECGNHGKCFYYINNSTKSFCYCDQGYSGRFCNLTYNQSCSSDSVSLNSSICLCSLNKFGSKCYLQHIVCQPNNNPCKNDGQCIPINDRISRNSFICLCTEDYMGSYCEYKSNRIDINFKMYPIPSSIFAHFITAFNDRDHEPMTTFKKVPFDQDSISLFIRKSFHILFIEFSNNYYLTVLREKSISGEHISTDIKIDNMCVNITQILNSTLLSYTYLHRLKYYPLQCFQNRRLMCFYDENYMCVCDKTRFSNCFKFNHTASYNCQGHNYCEHDGQCFQNNITCPTTATCLCEKCYYGNKCQLTTKGFSLSLDVIFGYHIKSSLSFTKQSKAVKITASITIIMFVLGLINGLLSILTFRRKSLIQVGCGIYLLTNSIISLLTITFFTIKYWQLIVFQMNVITNRSFIKINCILTDVLLKILLSFGDWLNACVAIERTYTTKQGVRFNKAKTKYIAKYVILIISFLITVSYIHDPISRQLVDDEDEDRTWCIVNYSSNLKIFDRFINLFHFLTPFIINFLSALMIIVQLFRMRSKAQNKLSRKTVLYAEIKRHKHILISPCFLVLLAFPRLIISMSSRCMESARDPWLFLIGYYISFVPSLLIFVLFILPSKNYTDEFLTVIKRQR